MARALEGKVAVVTGAGQGIGREVAIQMARHGARVVVNDIGVSLDGTSTHGRPAEDVVNVIRSSGGEGAVSFDSVSDWDSAHRIVETAVDTFGRIDIVVNNAGILRDATFAKMRPADFAAVVGVHLTGSVNCTLAVWPHMKAANYGRVVMTSSSSGIYGNFGQSNYAAAKMAVVGLMNVLHIEGGKNNIRVNTIAPGATTRMTETLLPPAVAGLMDVKAVTPGVLYLVSEDAPSRVILCAGAGGFARTMIYETEGIFLEQSERTPEAVAAHFAEISDPAGQHPYENGGGQVMKFVQKAAKAAGVKLG